MKPFAQLVVFGAGAMGSWLGARAEAPAVLVARGEHARAMRERGLKLGGVSEGIMPVTVADACPLLGPDTLLLVCVKSGDLAVAGEACAPLLAPDTVVAVIANGLAPEAELAAALGRPVVRVVSSFGATMNAPGHVSGWGGRALLAEDEDARRVGALLATTGLKVEHHADLRPVVWEKLAVNCVANPLAGLTGRRNRELVHPDLADLRRAVVDEVRAVAAAEGVDLPEDLIKQVDSLLGRSNNLNSMAQDVLRGRRTEIEAINGAVVRRGAELGVSTPANTWLAALVRLGTGNH